MLKAGGRGGFVCGLIPAKAGALKEGEILETPIAVHGKIPCHYANVGAWFDEDEDTSEISTELVAAPGTGSRRLIPNRPLKSLEHHLTTVGSYGKGERDSFELDRGLFPVNIPAFIKRRNPGPGGARLM